MKRIITITVLICNFLLLSAQFEFWDELLMDPTLIPQLKSTYVYDPNGPIKTMRVNLHYMLRSDGTGNFTETTDSYTGSPYNGYLYGEDLINACNENWALNIALKHQPNPPNLVHEKKVRFVLNGVFFHRNTSDYNKSDQYQSSFS